jgi:Tfp pilus assembly protein PilV
MRRSRRARGATLIEILISLAVVLVGMLGMFRTLATSVTGSSTASKLTQAQQRAVLIMEAIRVAPTAALICLANTASSGWSSCEATCRDNLTLASADACVFTSLTVGNTKLKAASDVNQQNYFLVTYNGSNLPVAKVGVVGTGGKVYEAQVVIGWRDDNSPGGNTVAPDHAVVLRSGVFAP